MIESREVQLAVLAERRRWLVRQRSASILAMFLGAICFAVVLFRPTPEAQDTLGAFSILVLISAFLCKRDTDRQIKFDDEHALQIGKSGDE